MLFNFQKIKEENLKLKKKNELLQKKIQGLEQKLFIKIRTHNLSSIKKQISQAKRIYYCSPEPDLSLLDNPKTRILSPANISPKKAKFKKMDVDISILLLDSTAYKIDNGFLILSKEKSARVLSAFTKLWNQ